MKRILLWPLSYPGDTLSDGIVILNFLRPCILKRFCLISFLYRLSAHILTLLKNTKVNVLVFACFLHSKNWIVSNAQGSLLWSLCSCCLVAANPELRRDRLQKKDSIQKRGENCTFKLKSSIFLPSKTAAAEFYSTYIEVKYSRNLICIFRIFTLVGCNFQLLKLFRQKVSLAWVSLTAVKQCRHPCSLQFCKSRVIYAMPQYIWIY